MLTRYAVGPHDLGGTPFRGAPVESLPLLDDNVHRPHRLLNRCIWVGTMAEHEIDIIELEAAQLYGLPENAPAVLCGMPAPRLVSASSRARPCTPLSVASSTFGGTTLDIRLNGILNQTSLA